jgi:phage/plasmid-associated DNA primase
VYDECQKECEFSNWVAVTTGNTAKNVVEFLSNANDFQFPLLQKSRHVFAFRNGIYITTEDRFYPFETGAAKTLSNELVACKFFDSDFDAYEHLQEDDDWLNIPTPHFQSILDHQEFDSEVCKWLYILFGRLLYDINTHDGWTVQLFLKGLGGTGKSILCLKAAKNLFSSEDVAILSNNAEKRFGLSSLYGKFLWLAPEIRGNFSENFDQAELLSMISGEDVSIAKKHQQALSCRWTACGLMCGNELPQWSDSGGSISRRLVVFDFQIPVRDGDMRLGNKIEEEVPALLVKINRGYRKMAAEAGHMNIWNILPPYLLAARDTMAQSTSSLEALLNSNQVDIGEDKYCPFDEFVRVLKQFERDNGYKEKKKDADYFRQSFTKFNIRKSRAVREYRGERLRKDWLFGVDIAGDHADGGNVFG